MLEKETSENQDQVQRKGVEIWKCKVGINLSQNELCWEQLGSEIFESNRTQAQSNI
jgi:hypothetical protein